MLFFPFLIWTSLTGAALPNSVALSFVTELTRTKFAGL